MMGVSMSCGKVHVFETDSYWVASWDGVDIDATDGFRDRDRAAAFARKETEHKRCCVFLMSGTHVCEVYACSPFRQCPAEDVASGLRAVLEFQANVSR